MHAVRAEQYSCAKALMDDGRRALPPVVTIWNSVVPGIDAGI
jgi:hypothetical protein